MRFLADENFPRPALDALRKAGWEVVSIAEECPGVPDEDVAALCAAQERILLTFDKDFGELVFHRASRLAAGLSCSASRRIPQRMRRRWLWRWFSRTRILPGRSA